MSTANAPEKTDAPEVLDALKALRQAIFLISLPLGILSFILPVYGAELGAGAVQIGLFFSVFSLALVLLRPLVGAGLDRYGRRPFVLAGLAGYAISMGVFALWVEVWGVIVARGVQGVAAACLWIAIRAITADVAQAEQRGRTFGGMEQASSQGSMLGIFIAIALLMGIVEVGDPWPVLFGGYGAAGLVALWLAGRLARLLGVDRAIYLPLKVGGETHSLLTIMGADLASTDVPAMSIFASQASIARPDPCRHHRKRCRKRTLNAHSISKYHRCRPIQAKLPPNAYKPSK